MAPAQRIWQTPDLPVVAELARLAVGEEEVVGEEDRLRLAVGLLRGKRVSSSVVNREGGIGDAGGVGGGGRRGLWGRGRVRQALHGTCKEKGWPRLRDSSDSRWHTASPGHRHLAFLPGMFDPKAAEGQGKKTILGKGEPNFAAAPPAQAG